MEALRKVFQYWVQFDRENCDLVRQGLLRFRIPASYRVNELFSHYQRHGKCEWRGGGLDKFVSHYNRENGTSYVHTECLDIVRTGGQTKPKAEVLVTDATRSTLMVVERKSVVWPPNYILRHHA